MDKLALFKGKKAVKLDYEKVGNRPLVNQKGMNDALALIKKGEISQSKTVFEFEDKFAAYIGAAYAVATNNGTSSIHTALFAVGVEAGDEVLVPSYTFWATLGPIFSQHAIPVFCDVDKDTFCMDPADIEAKITKKTKAILLVHVWGNMCELQTIKKIAKKHNLKIVEDCSHAHGAKYKNKMAGVFGDVGCFSLQASKLLPAGEGGILVTNKREYYERSLAFAHYDRLADLPASSKYRKYMLTGMGYKYRAHPAAIALANSCLPELDERNAIRNSNARELEKLTADLPWLRQQAQYKGSERIYSYQYMYFDNKQFGGIHTLTLLKALAAEGVVCGYCGYGRLHSSPLVLQGGPEGDCGKKNNPVKLKVTEDLAEHSFLAAPRFENVCPDLIKQYSDAFHKINEHRDALKEYDKSYDYKQAAKSLSGRSIALIK
jgi:dTDP-4-amino-4,6-dideoxygalactose transaminase